MEHAGGVRNSLSKWCEMPSEHALLVLPAADVRELLTIGLAIESQRTAFMELGRGHALLPARLLIEGDQDSVSFCYAARLAPDGGAVCKFGSVNPANANLGLPTISALITILDGADGRPVAIMDGPRSPRSGRPQRARSPYKLWPIRTRRRLRSSVQVSRRRRTCGQYRGSWN